MQAGIEIEKREREIVENIRKGLITITYVYVDKPCKGKEKQRTKVRLNPGA